MLSLVTAPHSEQIKRTRRVRESARTPFGDLARVAAQIAATASTLSWPSLRYQSDPVAFFREVLGVEPWEKQRDIILAVRDHKRVAIASGHKVSKALAIDTPIPTPNGWSTMGALRVGDEVFDEHGHACRIVDATSVMYGHRCFDVEFSDTSIISADEGHLWSVHLGGATRIILTTAQIRRATQLGVRFFVDTRAITAVYTRTSVPVRCITVNSPSHQFLCGETFIPTHNSHTAAGLALWFYCSFADARVVMSSTTSRQVDQILWRELRMMHARSKHPIGGDLHELARSGLKAADFREVVGFTAREAEAVAGISGRNLLYILDEASGIPDIIFEAIEGNRAGGARVALFSNPTRTEGEFFRAFHEKAAFYKTLQVSSEETPNVREGREVIPGLAGREWIEEKKVEWGEDSAFYKIRVRGEFVLQEDGKILTVHAIGEAETRWHDARGTGRLCIGVDPAGPGQGGDETVFAVRRGDKVLTLIALRGVFEDSHLAHLLGILKEHRGAREPLPLVLVDREGPIGSRLFGLLRAHADRNLDSFEVVGVRSSDRAAREPQIYDRVRDELWANLARWLREGGAIPEDVRLAKELHAPEWVGQLTGRLKATPKDEIRKKLGRSPDRADAVALSVWEPVAYQLRQPESEDDVDDDWVAPEIDPYDLADPTGGYS